MEKTKLTLRIEKPVIEAAKAYAGKHDTTLSKLVSEFLQALTSDPDLSGHTPILRELNGILPEDASISEHHTYLEEKYGL